MNKIINGSLDSFIDRHDTDGNIINASDGGIIYADGMYHWYGQALRALPNGVNGKGGQSTTTGVVMYASKDLCNWQYEGVILACSDDPASELYAPMRFERPKIIYNEKTKQYVLWCHYVKYPGDHGNKPGTGDAGVAVCDTVNGKYRWLGHSRPIDDKGFVRDCTVYKDRDGSAYFIYDRQVGGDRCQHIVKLSGDYLSFTNEYKRIDEAFWREAAAVVFRNGYYYMVTSDLTSWRFNQAKYFRAKSLFGPWEDMGDPCVGDDDHTTFRSQTTYIFKVEGKDDLYIHMAERHNTENFLRCSYIWLPISFGDDNTLSLSYLEEWTIDKPSSEIKLNFNTYPLYVGNESMTDFTNWDGYGASIDLEAAVTGASAEDITWTVSDSGIASITPDASNKARVNVKAHRTGYVTVTASLPDGASASCCIPVIDNYNRFQTQRIVLNADTLRLAKNNTAQLKAILYPKEVLQNNPVKLDNTLTWESSDEAVAKVDADGKITAVAAGTAEITVKSADVGRTAVCSVTVIEGATDTKGITAPETGIIDMTVGEKTQLTADAAGGGYVYWRSENSYIADVDQNGMVTAYSNSNVQVVSEDGMDVTEETGTVKIYATTAEGGYAAEYDIRVSDAPVSVHGVKINKSELSVPLGAAARLTAVAVPSRILQPDVTWTSSDENVVKAEPAGKTIFGAAQAAVTPVSIGTAIITAEYGGKSETCIVTVTNGGIKIKADEIEFEDKTIDIDEVYRFTPSVTANATDSRLIWLDTDENIATIDREGNVMGYSEGTVTVYAIARDSLTPEEIQALEDLKYDVRTIGTENEILNGILEHAVYKSCALTVKNEENDIYLRNLHVPAEAITDNSVSLLWNRASLVFAADIDKYVVYRNGVKEAETVQLAYTVNGLDADAEYTFKVEAYNTNGEKVKEAEITAKTKPVPTAILNVLDYGAAGTGLVTDTYAIQRAIDDCPAGGVVWLPGNGRIYYSGALFLKSDMTFKVDGVLLGSIDPKDYPAMITRWEGWRKLPQSEDEWANSDNLTQPVEGEYKQIIKKNHYQHSSLINAGTYDEGENSETSPFNVHDLVICGHGQINGNGFSLAINEGPNLPQTTDRAIKDQSFRGRTVLIQNARNVYMRDVMISYSPSWTIHIIYCDNMSIDDIDVISLGNGNVGSGCSVPSEVGHIRNGDGIDPDSCTNMNIYNSYFRTGDDVITLKSGRNKEGNDLDKPNAYIRVTDCFAHSSIGGYGSGSETAAGSHDVLFQSLYLETNDCFGIWYKTHPARGGLTENIQVRDCVTGGGNSIVRVSYDFSLEDAKPAQTLNRADNGNKRYKTKARYLTYENVGGIGWAGENRYAYDMKGLYNNRIHTDKGMPEGISIEHVTIRNASISGNPDCGLVNCHDVKIRDVKSDVNWKQTASSDVTIE